jgi:hypothetical protein
MPKLAIETLTRNSHLCFSYSRDNATFTQEQRNKWLIQGMQQKARLIELIGKELSESIEEKVIAANAQLKTINERLQDKEESLRQYADTIQKISDVVVILDIIIGLGVPV